MARSPHRRPVALPSLSLDERIGRFQLLAMLIGAKSPEAVLNCDGCEDLEHFDASYLTHVV